MLWALNRKSLKSLSVADKNVQPTKVILTFAPCGREKTLKFIRWLGVSVPKEVEDRILGATPEEKKVPRACKLLCALRLLALLPLLH